MLALVRQGKGQSYRHFTFQGPNRLQRRQMLTGGIVSAYLRESEGLKASMLAGLGLRSHHICTDVGTGGRVSCRLG